MGRLDIGGSPATIGDVAGRVASESDASARARDGVGGAVLSPLGRWLLAGGLGAMVMAGVLHRGDAGTTAAFLGASYLGLARRAIRDRRAGGCRPGGGGALADLPTAGLLSATILAASLSAFAGVYVAAMCLSPINCHWSPWTDAGCVLQGTFVGTLAAAWVCSRWRRALWPLASPGISLARRAGLIAPTLPLVVVGVAAMAIRARDHHESCRRTAEHYETEARDWAKSPDVAAQFRRRARWYESAAARPWWPDWPTDRFPVEPAEGR